MNVFERSRPGRTGRSAFPFFKLPQKISRTFYEGPHGVELMIVSPQVQRVKARLDALGVSAATLCVLCGVSPSQFSNALRGIKPLDGQAEFRLATMSLRLTELSESVAPLKLPSDAGR